MTPTPEDIALTERVMASGGLTPIGLDPTDTQARVMSVLAYQRDQEVEAGLPRRMQQTIVGAISGAGDRHVVQPISTGEVAKFPNPVFSPSGAIDVATADTSGYAPGTGVSEVDGVNRITFDQDNFEIFDGGGGEVIVKLKTCPATCP